MVIMHAGRAGRRPERRGDLCVLEPLLGPQPTTPLPPASAGGELSELSGDELRIVFAALEEPGAERQAVFPQDVDLEDLSALELRALLESLEG